MPKIPIATLRETIPHYDLIVGTAQEKGVSVFFVGGCVRDILLGVPVKDVDVVTFDTEYDRFGRWLGRKLKGAVVPFKDNLRLVKGDVVIDCSAPRGNTLEEDLLLRDFTINNLALSSDGTVIGDTADLGKGVIRHAHARTFDDDPVRIMRAYRFRARFGFALADETAELIRKKRDLLPNVAVERVFEEYKKMLLAENLPVALQEAERDGVLDVVLPGIELAVPAAAAGWRVCRDKRFDEERALALISALLLQDSGTESTIAVDMLNYPKKIGGRITALVQKRPEIETMLRLNRTEEELRQFAYHRYDLIDDLLVMAVVNHPSLKEQAKRLGSAKASLDMARKNIVGGGDLMKLGMQPGPQFKIILDDVQERLVLNRLEDKDAAYSYIQAAYREGV